MNPSETNDPIEALLLEQNAYIEDAGFTARVAASLPRRRPPWGRAIFLLGIAMLGAVLAVWWMPWENVQIEDFSTLPSLDLQALCTCLMVVGSLGWSVISAAQSED